MQVGTAVVVGSGPNGLGAAVTLALAGVEVTVLEAAAEPGGGTRTSELTVPGLLHDHCSAVHPLAVTSPFLRDAGLDRCGLTWRYPEVGLAHPWGEGSAAAVLGSVADTAAQLGPDREGWLSLFEPLVSGLDGLLEDVMRPPIRLPRHPGRLAGFARHALQPASWLARRWDGQAARALFAGASAHAFRPFTATATSAVGLMLLAAGHRSGWPVAEGGSRAITRALVERLDALGGRVETGVTVRSLDELPRCDAVLLDLAPRGVVEIAGERLPSRVRRSYTRYRHGPAAFKLDLAVDGGVPWRDPLSPRAGTVHVGGTYEEVAAAELAVHRGRMPRRPFVLVGQQYLADPTRCGTSAGDVVPVWAYAHVPAGYTGDATAAILDQVERFAPGTRERVVAARARGPLALQRDNANYVDGDIGTGANTAWQLLFRPRAALDPYRTGIPGVYLCSAATPPGAGVHGMCGYHAARSALR